MYPEEKQTNFGRHSDISNLLRKRLIDQNPRIQNEEPENIRSTIPIEPITRTKDSQKQKPKQQANLRRKIHKKLRKEDTKEKLRSFQLES